MRNEPRKPEGQPEIWLLSATELPELLADWLYVARIAMVLLRTRHLAWEFSVPSERPSKVRRFCGAKSSTKILRSLSGYGSERCVLPSTAFRRSAFRRLSEAENRSPNHEKA